MGKNLTEWTYIQLRFAYLQMWFMFRVDPMWTRCSGTAQRCYIGYKRRESSRPWTMNPESGTCHPSLSKWHSSNPSPLKWPPLWNDPQVMITELIKCQCYITCAVIPAVFEREYWRLHPLWSGHCMSQQVYCFSHLNLVFVWCTHFAGPILYQLITSSSNTTVQHRMSLWPTPTVFHHV